MSKNRSLLLLLLLFPAPSAFSADLPDCFLGRWRSNEALTVADMQQHPEVTAKARALFEKAFFGRLVIVYTRTRGGGYLEPEQHRSSLVLEPINVVASTSTSAVLRTSLLGVEQDSEWFCEGEHIYALVSRWKFREYFSRE